MTALSTLHDLLSVHQRLHAAIARREGTPKPPKPSAGIRIIAPKHPERVMRRYAIQIAYPRYWLWSLWLRFRIPTKDSAKKLMHRLRGYALWRTALWAEDHDEPLPLKKGTTIPGWALAHPTQRLAIATTTRQGEDDPATWWDTFGTDVSAYDWPQVDAGISAAELDAYLAQYIDQLNFQDWLGGPFMSDLQVLQLLEGAWNGQTVLWSAQDQFDAMGIQGRFDIRDEQMLNYVRSMSGSLIKGIDETTRQDIGQYLWEQLGGEPGTPSFSVDAIARHLQENLDVNSPLFDKMPRSRAYMIAVTETARAETFGQFLGMLQTGAKRKAWMITVGACRVCESNQSMGDIPILDPFPSGDLAPPGHPMCFPAGTMVSGPKAVGSISRFYEGPLVEIRTRRGYLLSVTPNHPILTPNGWIAAGKLKAGSQILCGTMRQRSMSFGDPNDQQIPSLIENVAITLGGTRDVASRLVKIASKDLHGDGANSKVGIVRTNRLLRNEWNSQLSQPRLHQQFSRSNVRWMAFDRLCNFASCIPRLGLASDGIMGGLSICDALLRGSFGGNNSVGIGIRSHLNASNSQDAMNSRSTNAIYFSKPLFRNARLIFFKKLGYIGRRPSTGTNRDVTSTQDSPYRGFGDRKLLYKSLHRFTSEITADNVISIQIKRFTGHVYNLETTEGWYLASSDRLAELSTNTGIITHNCRCSIAPGISEIFDPKDWVGPADPTLIDRIFQDPSWMMWPKRPVDLMYQGSQLAVPQGYKALLDFQSLPKAVRDVLTPQVINMLQSHLGGIVSGQALDDFLARVESLKTQKQAEQQAETTAPPMTALDVAENLGMFTLDQILAEAPPPEDTTLTERQRQTFEKLRQQLNDQFRKDLGLDNPDTTSRVIMPEQTRLVRLMGPRDSAQVHDTPFRLEQWRRAKLVIIGKRRYQAEIDGHPYWLREVTVPSGMTASIGGVHFRVSLTPPPRGVLDMALALADVERFDENLHPRGPNGRFIGGAGTAKSTASSPKDTSAAPKSRQSYDRSGVPMPFSAKEAIAAFHQGRRVAYPGRKNETRTITLNGTPYIMKMGEPSNPDAAIEQRNEAMVSRAIQRIGWTGTAVRDAWHIQDRQGNQYAIMTKEAGKTPTELAPIGIPTIPSDAYHQAILAEYVFGIDDWHGGNYLIDAQAQTMRHIDLGYAFQKTELDTWSKAAQLLQRQYGPHAPMEMMSIPAPLVRQVLSAKRGILATMRRYAGVNSREYQFAANRLQIISDARAKAKAEKRPMLYKDLVL